MRLKSSKRRWRSLNTLQMVVMLTKKKERKETNSTMVKVLPLQVRTSIRSCVNKENVRENFKS